MSPLSLASWGATLAVIVLALFLRSRAYAIFRGVVLSIYTLIAIAILPIVLQSFAATPDWLRTSATLLVYYLHAVSYLDPALLVRPRLRKAWYRYLISLPAQTMGATMLLAFPWAIIAAFGLYPWGWQIPFACGLVGLYQSLRLKPESHDLYVGATQVIEGPARVLNPPLSAPATNSEPLRIVQITDPHLGPFMTVQRLARICRQAVEEKPDLILLTGDFLTMESQAESAWLAEALAPLKPYAGKTYACLGNHDHEALTQVKRALAASKIQLLVDEQITIRAGHALVDLLGFDFHFRDRQARTENILAHFPRTPGALRIVLLHDPGAFKHLPSGSADLVLSGHTHGGHVGLQSLGAYWTVVNAIAKIPDHGLWGHGTNRLWVHRGTGHYGFPLRLGVSGEQSLLRVWQVAEAI